MSTTYRSLDELLAQHKKQQLIEIIKIVAAESSEIDSRIRLLASGSNTTEDDLQAAYDGLFYNVQNNFAAEWKQHARIEALFVAIQQAELEPMRGLYWVFELYNSIEAQCNLTCYFEDLSPPFQWAGVEAFNFYARQLPLSFVTALVKDFARKDDWDVAQYLSAAVESGFAKGENSNLLII